MEAMPGRSEYEPRLSLHPKMQQIRRLSVPFVNGLRSSGILSRHLLLLVQDGRGSLKRGSDDAALFPHSCWLLLPGERVEIREDDELPLQGYAIVFDVWGIRHTDPPQPSDAPIEPAKFPVSGRLEGHLVEEIQCWIEENSRTGCPSDEYEAYAMNVRFMELMNQIWRSSRDRRHKHELREAIRRTVSAMEQTYAHPITRRQLSRLANMSPSHYSSAFKQETGKSPMEALAEIRIRHAKKQLLFSDRKLREIAESVGYRNEFYFSRQFKQWAGVSPSAYARMHYADHARVSHPFSLHLQSLGLGSAASSVAQDSVNVVGLYVEDFLVSLGIKPVLKCVGNHFKQGYLNAHLKDVQEWSLLSFDFDSIAEAKPDLIILGHPGYGDHGRFDRFAKIAPTYSIRKGLHHWEKGIRMIGHLTDRLRQAESIISDYKRYIHAARAQLADRSGETVTLVRICNDRHIRLYGGPDSYSGIVLYQDLGLKPSDSVASAAWNRPFVRIGADELFRMETDHLFIVADPAGRAYWRQIAEDPRWNRLPCVKRHRCYEVRFDTWMTFGLIAHQAKVRDVLRFLAPSRPLAANNRI